MHVLEHLEPKSVFRYFEELSAIPRGTFDTKRGQRLLRPVREGAGPSGHPG